MLTCASAMCINLKGVVVLANDSQISGLNWEIREIPDDVTWPEVDVCTSGDNLILYHSNISSHPYINRMQFSDRALGLFSVMRLMHGFPLFT